MLEKTNGYGPMAMAHGHDFGCAMTLTDYRASARQQPFLCASQDANWN